MKTSWFKECKTKEDKDKIRQTVIANRASLDRLKEILEPLLKETPSSADYDSPSWAYKQADRNNPCPFLLSKILTKKNLRQNK